MSLSIVGAGFGRTGTSSLELALEQLGFTPCYHMEEVRKNPGHSNIWQAAVGNESIDWIKLLGDFRATVDWPASFFWRELMEVYPQSKVLLSVREPQKWYASMQNTIFELLRAEGSIGNSRSMATELILGKVFPGDVDDRDYVLGVYHAHIESVRQSVPASRLLIYDVREGWAPLCRSLDVDVPKQDFPRRNSTAEFRHSTEMRPLEK